MKKLILALLATALVAPAVSAQVRVRGYYRSDGTYVQPHVRSSPNNTTTDNYSTRGNVNPYTGQAGTRDPYAPRSNNPYGSTNSNPYGTTNSNPYSAPRSNPYGTPRTTMPCYYNCPN